MEESSAILYPGEQYTLDFAGLGRPNGYGGLVHPGDIDLVYGNMGGKHRWLLGEVKRDTANFNKGQRYFQTKFVNDLRPEVILAYLVFTPDQLINGLVKAKDCKVIALYYKPFDATEGQWTNINMNMLKLEDLIMWVDESEKQILLRQIIEY